VVKNQNVIETMASRVQAAAYKIAGRPEGAARGEEMERARLC
jgi:hypothetical protein